MEKTTSKIMAYVWLALGIVTAIAVLVHGAWHHLATIGICYIMYRASKGEESPAEE